MTTRRIFRLANLRAVICPPEQEEDTRDRKTPEEEDEKLDDPPSLLLQGPYVGSTGASQGQPTPRPGTKRNSWSQRGIPSHPYKPRAGGGTGAATNRQQRYCQESHDAVSQQQCEDCDKYRHWPEGTNEGPRECWHDWQAIPRSNEPDSNSTEEP
jgi:hypothetical protein